MALPTCSFHGCCWKSCCSCRCSLVHVDQNLLPFLAAGGQLPQLVEWRLYLPLQLSASSFTTVSDVPSPRLPQIHTAKAPICR